MPETMHKESPCNSVLTHSYSRETRPMTAARTRRKQLLVINQISSPPLAHKRINVVCIKYPIDVWHIHLPFAPTSHLMKEGQRLHDNALCNPNIVTDFGQVQSRIGFNVSSSIRGMHRCKRTCELHLPSF